MSKTALADTLLPMASQVISGYQLLEVLGEGPRGVVYKARDLQSGAYAAVKIYHSDAPGQPHNLRHPNVASVFGSGLDRARPFTVTEYLSGGTLKDHIQSLQSVGGLFSLDQIVTFAGQISEGLIYAHRQGIAHGNLKPQNVMFSDSGEAKLIDFAPQTGDAYEAGRQADLENFGRLLYEVAAGRPPLPGAPAMPVINAVRPDLPPGFAEILSRIVDRRRSDRYDDLSSAVRGLKSISSSMTATRAAAGVAAAPPALAAGRLLAGRFKIVEFIARGGMGDVYEAEDIELRERVALKTVRPEIAGAAHAMERFRREIHLARKVTHPNVCRIFDIFHDGAGSEKITFLTMELLSGETLHQKVQREGRASVREAFPIIQQMAAGLRAAHRAGVIHRDFKSSNVILVPSEGGREARAVVTDFGLARPALNNQSLVSLSNPFEAVGTPAYMAPEQLEGGDITPAADVYALGIVIYEMIAGVLPFDGDSAMAIALKRLQGPPPSPRNHAPELDDAWEAAILHCLERKPTDRFQDVEEVVNALTGAAAVSPVRRAGSRRPAVPGAMIVAALLLAAALVAVAIWNGNRLSGGIRSRPAIAVLGFNNVTRDADSAWLSTALAEMLTTELAAGERLRAIPGENIARMKAELALPSSGSYAQDTLARIRSYLGADIIVHGSYVVTNEGPAAQIRLDLRLQNAVQGIDLESIVQTGYTADLLELVSRTGIELRRRLGAETLNPDEASVAQAALPATPAAARFYAEGLEKLRVFDAQGARESLEKAVREDDRHALARSALATAWVMLGHTANARQQAKIALDLSAKLGREDKLVVEARSHETALQWGEAVQRYETLFGFFPDNIEYGLRLAAAQTSSGKGKEALATIALLRKFPPPDGSSPRIDLAEARAAGAVSDFPLQQSKAALAATKARSAGAKLLLAGARLIEGNAFASLGDLKQAEAALKDAREMYSAAGDRWDAANASTNLAYVRLRAGDLKDAEDIYRQSLAIYEELGDQKGKATALASIATVYRSRGDFQVARRMHEEALKIYRGIGDRGGEATASNNLANVLSLMGDSRAAREMFEAALNAFREIGDRNALATVLSNLGDLVSEEGDLARARELYEESRDAFRALANRSSLAHVLSRLGDLELINGDLAAARERHQEALGLRKQLGEEGSIGESDLALAQIALHEGNAAAAEAAARAAAEEFRSASRPDDEASALAVLARSLISRDKNAESGAAIQRSQELALQSDDVRVRLSVAITAASILAAQGDAVGSIKEFEAVIVAARNEQLIRLELEARLALAEVEISSGRALAAQHRLMALETDALKRGFKYIADRASAARKKISTTAA